MILLTHMGTIIRSVGTAKSVFDGTFLRLIFRAADRCLRNGRVNARDVGMILNAGVYNENHQGEPAIATLIQNRLQPYYIRNRMFSKEPGNTLSFDIHNGGGGILDALQVADSFIASGEIEYGLIVAGDTKPSAGASRNYNYFPSAGAVLLSQGSGGKGFGRFKSKTYPEHINDLTSSTNWDTGKFRFIIEQKACYLEDCIRCAEDATKAFLDEEDLYPEDIDLLITSQSPPGFRGKFINKIGFKDKMTTKENSNEIYSSGLVFSLSNVFNDKKFNISKNVLFLTVGSGITVSLSLYRN